MCITLLCVNACKQFKKDKNPHWDKWKYIGVDLGSMRWEDGRQAENHKHAQTNARPHT